MTFAAMTNETGNGEHWYSDVPPGLLTKYVVQRVVGSILPSCVGVTHNAPQKFNLHHDTVNHGYTTDRLKPSSVHQLRRKAEINNIAVFLKKVVQVRTSTPYREVITNRS